MSYLQSILGTNEDVIYKTRRHWLVIARPVIVNMILSLVLIVGTAKILADSGNQVVLLLLFLLIIPLGRLAIVWLNWWNEQYIVTDRRIVQVEGVFNKHVVDSSLEKVNDVVMSQSFMGRLLGYGDMEILTASDIGINKLDVISNPVVFKKTMLDQKELLGPDNDDLSEQRGERAETRSSVTALIGELAALRDKGLLTDEEFQTKKKEILSRI